jgi:hypothetical protein
MYKLEYDDDGCLMMVKIEEVCLFSPKAIDGVIARLRSLRDNAWHDWPADRHNRKALEVVIRNGGVKVCSPPGVGDGGAAAPAGGLDSKPQRAGRAGWPWLPGGRPSQAQARYVEGKPKGPASCRPFFVGVIRNPASQVRGQAAGGRVGGGSSCRSVIRVRGTSLSSRHLRTGTPPWP